MWRRVLAAALLAAALPLAPLAAQEGTLPIETLLEANILAQAGESLPATARLEFVLPPEAPARIAKLLAVEQDLRANIFAVMVETEAGEKLSFRGKVYALIDVPVPTRPISPGERVKAEDFTSRALPALGMGRNALTDLSQIEGQEARRLLPEGRVVQSQSLQPPRVVKRGEKLVLIYSHGALEVTAPARSLEDAALGDTVRVQNLNSNKTVTGIAAGDGRVEVGQ